MSTVAVTGASGFVGHCALDAARAHGLSAVGLGRTPVTDRGVEHRHFELGPAPDPAIFDGVEVLVHCAYDFTVTRAEQTYLRNVVGTANLLRAARHAGVGRIVFISSMSAYDGTRQLYGRGKLEGERLAVELGGVALRLGLVWGPDPGGMAKAVQKLTGLPIVPVLGAHSYQYTVHRDDVTQALGLAMVTSSMSGVIGVAHPDRVATMRLLDGLARPEGGSPAGGRRLPVPWPPVFAAMRVAEAVRVSLPLRADSVLGLVKPAPAVPRVELWSSLGLELRAFPG
jgi:nucleoside-diphosphate-sugar epimerase